MLIPDAFWRELATVLPASHYSNDPTNCHSYSYDNGRHRSLPSGVVWAESSEQVQSLVQTCVRHRVPLTPRGRGTGTPGGALANPGSLILSLERMTQVLDFNPTNRSLRVEAGVLNQTVQDLAATANLFWPPDPSSAAFCTVGGNLAYNAGGPRAVKYGATRDHVLALTAVSGTGERFTTGFAMPKTACGYDLTHLLIGSEGTLAVIVDATLRLLPRQPTTATLQVWFTTDLEVAHVIPSLLAYPAGACAIEYMDSACLALLRLHSDLKLPDGANALLMVEVDGLDSALDEAIHAITTICHNAGALKVDSARDATLRQHLWQARKALSPLLRQLAPHKINEDIVVPIDRLPMLFDALTQLARDYDFTMVNFGHIGSGNLHVNVLLNDYNDALQQQVNSYLETLFGIVLNLGGALSGEHGIGRDKKPFLSQAVSPNTLNLMRAIKTQFDPFSLLNPDTLFL